MQAHEPSDHSSVNNTQMMLEELASAISELTSAHHKLADLLAAPQRSDSGASLDEAIIMIREGHVRLEAAEQKRKLWLASQPGNASAPHPDSVGENPHQNMQQALAAVDRAEGTDHVSSWLALQPKIIELDQYNQTHQMVLSRLGHFLQESVNLLTGSADGSDDTTYAASGKTGLHTNRRRSLGDA